MKRNVVDEAMVRNGVSRTRIQQMAKHGCTTNEEYIALMKRKKLNEKNTPKPIKEKKVEVKQVNKKFVKRPSKYAVKDE